jgi:hypothetical protein
MRPLTDFQAQCAAAGVLKLLNARHFSICDLDALAKLIDVQLGGADYNALRAVHCIDYADMSTALRLQVREKCLELLGLPPQTLDVVQPTAPSPATHDDAPARRAGFLRMLRGRAGA